MDIFLEYPICIFDKYSAIWACLTFSKFSGDNAKILGFCTNGSIRLKSIFCFFLQMFENLQHFVLLLLTLFNSIFLLPSNGMFLTYSI